MIVTNSYYTKEAKELAASNKVELWNRKDLIGNLLKVRPEYKPKPEQNLTEGSSSSPQSKYAICGVTVSDKIRQYCLDHSDKFGGNIYCYKHQKEIIASQNRDIEADNKG